MAFFFQWLSDKGVRHIISVQVYDYGPSPHADECIENALSRFEIESLDWRKVDLDPRTIRQACPKLRELTLWWSGNNTTLRAWSEPAGLSSMPHLEKIRVNLPREIEVSGSFDCQPSFSVADVLQVPDSMARIEANIKEFEERLQANLDSQARKTETTADSDADPSAETKGERTKPSTDPDVTRQIKVQFSIISVETTKIDGPALATGHIGVSHQWLRCISDFSNSVSSLWKETSHPNGPVWATPKPVVVAIIDDGIDIFDPALPDGAVAGGYSLSSEKGRLVDPWFASAAGHGTMVASLITYSCRPVQVYPIRLAFSEEIPVNSCSLAKVISPFKPYLGMMSFNRGRLAHIITLYLKAIDKAAERADIVVFGTSMTVSESDNPASRHELENALHRVRATGKPLFWPVPHGSSALREEPHIWQHTFTIGAAKDDGVVDDVFSEPYRPNFIFPNANAVKSHINESSSDLSRLLDVLSGSDNSSVPTALAAGLASILMCCYRIVTSFSTRKEKPVAGSWTQWSGSASKPDDPVMIEERSDYKGGKDVDTGISKEPPSHSFEKPIGYNKQIRRLNNFDGMRAAFENLGDLTEGSVIRVWETLGPLNRILGDESKDLDEKIGELERILFFLVRNIERRQ